jgi:dUTP pyrophosphatase
VRLKIATLEHAHSLPAYATEGAAGMDIASADSGVIYHGTHRIFRTGLMFEVPPGHELQIRSRSGMAAKHKIFVLNSPGTLDCDYRGELMIVLMNLGDANYEVKRGDRIAQAVFAPFIRADIDYVEELTPTTRGAGGFGSTGA